MAQLPKPFIRPSVDLGGVTREWRSIPANKVKVGDTIPDLGVITQTTTDRDGKGYVLRLTGAGGKSIDILYPLAGTMQSILAFTLSK